MSARDPWASIADRGQLGMDILTATRARAEGIIAREGCQLVGAIRPDDGPAFLLSFLTAEDAAGFVEEMQPHNLRVLVADGEDHAALRAAILGGASGATVH